MKREDEMYEVFSILDAEQLSEEGENIWSCTESVE